MLNYRINQFLTKLIGAITKVSKFVHPIVALLKDIIWIHTLTRKIVPVLVVWFMEW